MPLRNALCRFFLPELSPLVPQPPQPFRKTIALCMVRIILELTEAYEPEGIEGAWIDDYALIPVLVEGIWEAQPYALLHMLSTVEHAIDHFNEPIPVIKAHLERKGVQCPPLISKIDFSDAIEKSELLALFPKPIEQSLIDQFWPRTLEFFRINGLPDGYKPVLTS